MEEDGSRRPSSSRAYIFNPRRYVRPGLPEEEVQELKNAFDLFDESNSGYISPDKLKSILLTLGIDLKTPSIYQMIAELDKLGTNMIDFDQFVEIFAITSLPQQTTSWEEIYKVFCLFDQSHTGAISLEDLEEINRELGESLKKEEMKEMIERADADGDGYVTPEDFYAIMTRRTVA